MGKDKIRFARHYYIVSIAPRAIAQPRVLDLGVEDPHGIAQLRESWCSERPGQALIRKDFARKEPLVEHVVIIGPTLRGSRRSTVEESAHGLEQRHRGGCGCLAHHPQTGIGLDTG